MSSQPPFNVTFTTDCQSQLAHLADLAISSGWGHRFAIVLRKMLTELENRPREWGDPITTP